MKVSVIAFVVGVGIASGASAQGPALQGPEPEQIRMRQRIFMMEGVLERAVQFGVDNLRRRVRAVMPDDALLQGGAPQVRGFRLEGYGVFFDVEVPALRRSLAWSMRTMNETGAALARDVAAMRAFVESIPDQRARAEFERTLRRVQQQVGPMSVLADRTSATPPVGAQATAVASAAQLPEAMRQSADPLLFSDPSEAYTEEVRAALIDAMIENSGPLALADGEWLTVAARDNAPVGPFMAGDPDVVTLILRVRGGDLNGFRAGRVTLDEVRSRVQISEF